MADACQCLFVLPMFGVLRLLDQNHGCLICPLWPFVLDPWNLECPLVIQQALRSGSRGKNEVESNWLEVGRDMGLILGVLEPLLGLSSFL